MLGVVVIGRNEGSRLVRCLESVLRMACPVVYADSQSTDGSVAVAQSMGVEVVVLDPLRPMSAACGRKAGFDRLIHMHPTLQYVLFLDGDCELDMAFLPAVQAAMSERPEVAVVCGRLIERFPQASVYNRIANLEWAKPAGECTSCGGIAVYRANAYVQAGGFDDTVFAGEEPELCSRIRKLGYKVLRIDVAMSMHDINMHRLSQWWRRGVRTGYGALDVRQRHGLKDFNRLLISAWVWALAWPLVSIAMVTGVALSAGVATASGVAWLASSLLPLQILRVASTGRHRGLVMADALVYGALMMVNKWACAWGQLKWLLQKR